ncbi:hypothetical protein L1987_83706 [Smallanthus sonchifolius]|uniref:Uncharacterized protein n=1 Tax=Smallanthus sonchifolius TaxID=185202 RepID=A0ACB8YCS6_9ASTR|nr:hypothetical protein L1987_83706 [Smallanthus sonchifolius]
MPDNHKRRFVTSAEEDIISNLPEHLIDQILYRLLTEDAVRTSVLSKKWRYRWTTMSTLNLRDQFIKKLSKIGALAHNGFIRVINQIMIHHNGPVLKFVLCIPNIVLHNFQEVDQWMLILSRNGVRKLIILNWNRIYPIPSSVFSCLELRTLRLYNCIFKPPLEFQGFLNLEDIHLKSVYFGDNLGGNMINLPCLKKLTLDECDNVNNFNIKAEKLQSLKVYLCPDTMLLRLFHSEHLHVGHEADLELTSNYLESPDCLNQTLFMLQTVKMTSLEGSRPELLFIKLLLDHSPHLENIIIRPRSTADAQKVLNIAKAVMLFPRASANAKMVYLDPQP